MKGFVPPDPYTSVSTERYGVVYTQRTTRNRFPAANVRIVETEDLARAGAEESGQHYAARVLGPSKSSEGVMIYYLVEWL
ncbi:MAG: hypothetical protein OEZ10_03535 [Gammaproteobacteria bacterium]|nr:hypothetical protein [Gammaproteobacteria bacterium]